MKMMLIPQPVTKLTLNRELEFQPGEEALSHATIRGRGIVDHFSGEVPLEIVVESSNGCSQVLVIRKTLIHSTSELRVGCAV